jgi:lipoprotein-anchoring transpeptidase ErfK/SrfK
MDPNERRGRLSTALLVVGAALVVLAALPMPAFGISVSAPANVAGRVDVMAYLPATDPSGLAVLMVDGKVIRTAEAARHVVRRIAFRGVSLSPGAHKVEVLLRARGRILKPAAKVVTSWRRPMPALMLSPDPGGYGGQRVVVIARVGADTTGLRLRVNGVDRTTRAVRAGTVVNMGSYALGVGDNTIQLIATNPAATTVGTFRVRRLDYPWPTCIIVDKSDYRLYWIVGGVLVKTYPVAIGKSGTPTPARVWKVGERLYETLGGVYGPRRLRLFRRESSGSYTYTGYGIHGTNQEWVIGTMASHGCIRMYNRDILDLWPRVPLNTMVLTRE